MHKVITKTLPNGDVCATVEYDSVKWYVFIPAEYSQQWIGIEPMGFVFSHYRHAQAMADSILIHWCKWKFKMKDDAILKARLANAYAELGRVFDDMKDNSMAAKYFRLSQDAYQNPPKSKAKRNPTFEEMMEQDI